LITHLPLREAQTTDAKPVVYLVDGDRAHRDLLGQLLDAAGLKSQAYATAEAFLASWHPHVRGCLVLEAQLPGMSGTELQEHLRAKHASLPLIYNTGHGSVALAVSALKKGAVDFIEKPADGQLLLKAIRSALEVEQKQFEHHRQELDAQRRIEQLTPREREVLELIVIGRLNKQIADDLGISIKTVEVHRARVMEKMGVSSLAELVQHVMISTPKEA
jgi:FixJ family two-component response regulator